MNDKPLLSVVIVNYNVKYFLEQCLVSVERAAEGLDVEIFVVDNASTDDSLAYLGARFPQVIFIANTDNRGFAAANNQAIRQSKGEYVLLLNPDTLIGEDSLHTLCFFLDEHPQAAAVGVKMLDARGGFLPESKRCFPTPWVAFCKLFGLGKLFPHSPTFAAYSLPYLNPNKTHKVSVLAGAFMLMRREALDKAGLLDESFFMYGEDIDLSYRFVQQGYTNYYVPERILHYKGESARQDDKRYLKSFYGSMLIFFKKYHPRSGRFWSFFIRLAIACKVCLASLPWKRKRRTGHHNPIRHRRILVLSREASFDRVKAGCRKRMPEAEFINHWNLDEERVMDAICRRNRMKAFTDVVFCYPEVRFEQVLLFMDTLPDRINYHIYHRKNGLLISPSK
ncbi:MAG: glycosyltransferase family 2 protein [Tannerella sp.]|jgi:GT2 family glycosyltransferase|nr:glycosyltransferase family 2 protein [Tannerella sp.]